MIVNNIETYDGHLLHNRFAYQYFKDKTLPIGNILAFRAPMHVEADGDDLIVHKEHDQHGIVQQKGKCSVSITHMKDGAALGHTAINITAGKKAPGFAYSTNLNDEQANGFMRDVIDMFYATTDDVFIATTKIISK